MDTNVNNNPLICCCTHFKIFQNSFEPLLSKESLSTLQRVSKVTLFTKQLSLNPNETKKTLNDYIWTYRFAGPILAKYGDFKKVCFCKHPSIRKLKIYLSQIGMTVEASSATSQGGDALPEKCDYDAIQRILFKYHDQIVAAYSCIKKASNRGIYLKRALYYRTRNRPDLPIPLHPRGDLKSKLLYPHKETIHNPLTSDIRKLFTSALVEELSDKPKLTLEELGLIFDYLIDKRDSELLLQAIVQHPNLSGSTLKERFQQLTGDGENALRALYTAIDFCYDHLFYPLIAIASACQLEKALERCIEKERTRYRDQILAQTNCTQITSILALAVKRNDLELLKILQKTPAANTIEHLILLDHITFAHQNFNAPLLEILLTFPSHIEILPMTMIHYLEIAKIEQEDHEEALELILVWLRYSRITECPKSRLKDYQP